MAGLKTLAKQDFQRKLDKIIDRMNGHAVLIPEGGKLAGVDINPLVKRARQRGMQVRKLSSGKFRFLDGR